MLQIFPQCLRSGGGQSYSGAIWASIRRPHNSIRFTLDPPIPQHLDSLRSEHLHQPCGAPAPSHGLAVLHAQWERGTKKLCNLTLGEFQASEKRSAEILHRSDDVAMWTPSAVCTRTQATASYSRLYSVTDIGRTAHCVHPQVSMLSSEETLLGLCIHTITLGDAMSPNVCSCDTKEIQSNKPTASTDSLLIRYEPLRRASFLSAALLGTASYP